mmetsp:Transcript_33390/g.87930  ORF Transcript_33390/g.87930 Transcript_33390/m.87930 type:complete len:603 (-) Transcript_33390:959-2767(-)
MDGDPPDGLQLDVAAAPLQYPRHGRGGHPAAPRCEARPPHRRRVARIRDYTRDRRRDVADRRARPAECERPRRHDPHRGGFRQRIVRPRRRRSVAAQRGRPPLRRRRRRAAAAEQCVDQPDDRSHPRRRRRRASGPRGILPSWRARRSLARHPLLPQRRDRRRAPSCERGVRHGRARPPRTLRPTAARRAHHPRVGRLRHLDRRALLVPPRPWPRRRVATRRGAPPPRREARRADGRRPGRLTTRPPRGARAQETVVRQEGQPAALPAAICFVVPRASRHSPPRVRVRAPLHAVRQWRQHVLRARPRRRTRQAAHLLLPELPRIGGRFLGRGRRGARRDHRHARRRLALAPFCATARGPLRAALAAATGVGRTPPPRVRLNGQASARRLRDAHAAHDRVPAQRDHWHAAEPHRAASRGAPAHRTDLRRDLHLGDRPPRLSRLASRVDRAQPAHVDASRRAAHGGHSGAPRGGLARQGPRRLRKGRQADRRSERRRRGRHSCAPTAAALLTAHAPLRRRAARLVRLVVHVRSSIRLSGRREVGRQNAAAVALRERAARPRSELHAQHLRRLLRGRVHLLLRRGDRRAARTVAVGALLSDHHAR